MNQSKRRTNECSRGSALSAGKCVRVSFNCFFSCLWLAEKGWPIIKQETNVMQSQLQKLFSIENSLSSRGVFILHLLFFAAFSPGSEVCSGPCYSWCTTVGTRWNGQATIQRQIVTQSKLKWNGTFVFRCSAFSLKQFIFPFCGIRKSGAVQEF